MEYMFIPLSSGQGIQEKVQTLSDELGIEKSMSGISVM
jgi:hypothetical protein